MCFLLFQARQRALHFFLKAGHARKRRGSQANSRNGPRGRAGEFAPIGQQRSLHSSSCSSHGPRPRLKPRLCLVPALRKGRTHLHCLCWQGNAACRGGSGSSCSCCALTSSSLIHGNRSGSSSCSRGLLGGLGGLGSSGDAGKGGGSARAPCAALARGCSH